MGSGMAAQLLKAGHALTVYNRTSERAASLGSAGAKVAGSPGDAAEVADVVISMVADDAASRQVWLGKDGVLAKIQPNAIAVECSTLSPGWIRELAHAVNEHRCELLDAPVTGSKVHASAGELQFLVGGNAATLERVRPILKAMSRNIVHLGATGSGALMKLINNYLCGVQAASLAEGLAFLEHSGLDRERALEILNNGAPGSPLVKTISARMTARAYDIHFALHLMHKDLSYATREADTLGVRLNTGRAALKLFEQACEGGWGEKDFSAVVEALR